MKDLFLNVVNMSLSASVVILAVLVARLLLARAPKKWSYLLWSAVGFRLCCPVSLTAAFSLLGFSPVKPIAAAPVTPAVGNLPASTVRYLPPELGTVTGPVTPPGAAIPSVTPDTSVPAATPMQTALVLAVMVWVVGIGALVLSGVVNYLQMRGTVLDATRIEGNVYRTDRIPSPFILGIFQPKIYVPLGLDEQRMEYVLEHEQYHLKRGDHIVKVLAYTLLTLHWFNPLVWLAFYLMGKDMEMSCDEKVLGMGGDRGREYSMTLLSFAAPGRFPAAMPLCFGEIGVKSRIKNALNWRRPRTWVSLIAGALCVALVAACAVNPMGETNVEAQGLSAAETGPALGESRYYLFPTGEGLGLTGDDARIYENFAKRAPISLSQIDGHDVLLLASVRLYGSYLGDDGMTTYVCRLYRYEYNDFDVYTGSYSTVESGSNPAWLIISPDWQEGHVEEMRAGVEYSQYIRDMCGPLTDVAAWMNGETDVEPPYRQLGAAGHEELLAQYISYCDRVKAGGDPSAAPTPNELLTAVFNDMENPNTRLTLILLPNASGPEIQALSSTAGYVDSMRNNYTYTELAAETKPSNWDAQAALVVGESPWVMTVYDDSTLSLTGPSFSRYFQTAPRDGSPKLCDLVQAWCDEVVDRDAFPRPTAGDRLAAALGEMADTSMSLRLTNDGLVRPLYNGDTWNSKEYVDRLVNDFTYTPIDTWEWPDGSAFIQINPPSFAWELNCIENTDLVMLIGSPSYIFRATPVEQPENSADTPYTVARAWYDEAAMQNGADPEEGVTPAPDEALAAALGELTAGEEVSLLLTNDGVQRPRYDGSTPNSKAFAQALAEDFTYVPVDAWHLPDSSQFICIAPKAHGNWELAFITDTDLVLLWGPTSYLFRAQPTVTAEANSRYACDTARAWYDEAAGA